MLNGHNWYLARSQSLVGTQTRQQLFVLLASFFECTDPLEVFFLVPDALVELLLGLPVFLAECFKLLDALITLLRHDASDVLDVK